MFFLWVSLFGGCDFIKSQSKMYRMAKKTPFMNQLQKFYGKQNLKGQLKVLSQNKKSQTDGS